MTKTKWLTFPVAGAAYGKLSVNSTLTHKYNPETDEVLCKKVKPASILEDYSFDTEEAPSCPTCAARYAKLP